MRSWLASALKWTFRIYVMMTALLGMLVTHYFVTGYIYTEFVPKSLPVKLENGFIYASYPDPCVGEKTLLDATGRIAVEGNVRDLGIYGKTVYGSRRVTSEGTLVNRYFICAYGDDCSQTQDYTEKEFEEEVKNRNLPPFSLPYITNQAGLQMKEWLKIKLLGKEPFSAFFLKKCD